MNGDGCVALHNATLVALMRRMSQKTVSIESLPRREREVFELLCSLSEATAVDIQAAMADPPSYSSVRTILGRLEEKGVVRQSADRRPYLYKSVLQHEVVRESVLRQMVRTFFNDSAASAATALLGLSKKLSQEEIDALQRAVDRAKERE